MLRLRDEQAAEVAPLYDPSTGQRLFEPAINEKSWKLALAAKEPIEDELLQAGAEYQEKRERAAREKADVRARRLLLPVDAACMAR
jgi:molecular chaperone GrpE (heat shock protein)|eukprot:COSAG01_NODE_457_length_16751_cov_34.906918_3_plen_86_part_00